MIATARFIVRRLALVPVLVLLLAGSAGAAVKPDGAYGGGTPPNSVSSMGPAILVLASANPAGDQIELYAEGFTKCGAGELQHTAPVAADGKLTTTFTFRDRNRDRERRTSVWTMAIDFQGARATGTAHLDVTLDPSRGKTRKCSRDYAFELREVSGDEPMVAGGPDAGASYFGGTGQGYPFVMRVNADATKVTTTLFDLVLKCTPTRGRSYKDFINEISPSGKIAPDGAFVIRESFKVRYAEGTARFKVEIRGDFFQHGTVGSFTIGSTFTNAKTRRITERCKSSKVVFIGFT